MPTQQNKSNKKKPQPAKAGRQPKPASPSGAAERDETYGLISVLYHALQGAETYAHYIADAERAGDETLVEFFRDCQEQENERAKRAKQLLAIQLEGDAEDDDDDEDEDEDDEE
jgi:hypothetical protein